MTVVWLAPRNELKSVYHTQTRCIGKPNPKNNFSVVLWWRRSSAKKTWLLYWCRARPAPSLFSLKTVLDLYIYRRKQTTSVSKVVTSLPLVIIITTHSPQTGSHPYDNVLDLLYSSINNKYKISDVIYVVLSSSLVSSAITAHLALH